MVSAQFLGKYSWREFRSCSLHDGRGACFATISSFLITALPCLSPGGEGNFGNHRMDGGIWDDLLKGWILVVSLVVLTTHSLGMIPDVLRSWLVVLFAFLRVWRPGLARENLSRGSGGHGEFLGGGHQRILDNTWANNPPLLFHVSQFLLRREPSRSWRR